MDFYNKIAKGYEELHKEEQLRKIRLIKKYLNVRLSDKLLDVGCGMGLTTIPWKCKRYGIDPSEILLERTRQKNKIVYKKAYAEKIPYKSNFFDVVISVTAIQNFKDMEKGLREIKRVGKNSFVLTFLKKSSKKDFIEKLIKKHFKVEKKIEEDKDIIFFAKK
ncbi:class I SAM-dependent methyltransferase [Candidatus Woesearchaeota archaeon]|nr:class I SAM-dependent methyltransferase [Candidatus Woesearchaeota archaeon]